MTGRLMLKGALFLLVGIALGAGAGAALWYAPNPVTGILPEPIAFHGPPLTAAPAPVVGAPAPDFSLVDLNGDTVQLSDLRGSPVILNFWATWCEPCKAELPLLDEAATGASGGLRVLAVESEEAQEDVLAFLREAPLRSVTILMDPDGDIRSLYLVLGYPTTYFLDADGIIRNRKVGTYDSSELHSILKDLGAHP
jgi:thiol-disulfide isomerase/thioredoxin